MNRTRLSNVVDNRVNLAQSSEASSPSYSASFFPTEKRRVAEGVRSRNASTNEGKSILRRRRKLQMNLQYSDAADEVNMLELTSVQVPSSTKDIFRQSEPDWTMQVVRNPRYTSATK